MNVEELAALKESLERERAERQLTEKELEEKVGALHSLNQELQLSNQKLEKLDDLNLIGLTPHLLNWYMQQSCR